MTPKRLIQTASLILVGGAMKRAEYLKKRHIFGYIGNKVRYQGRVIPLYPELIKLHDNVFIARNVHFETHDMISAVINTAYPGAKVPEHVGCIEIMDNVFVGSDTTILYGVRIGENCVIGSGSLVNKDCEPDSIYAGVPAKKVGTWETFVEKRMRKDYSYIAHNQNITSEEINTAWEMFYEKHEKQ